MLRISTRKRCNCIDLWIHIIKYKMCIHRIGCKVALSLNKGSNITIIPYSHQAIEEVARLPFPKSNKTNSLDESAMP